MTVPGDPGAWLIAYTSKIAADLTVRLLEAVGKRIARSFQEEPRQAALRQALSEGLQVTISRLNLPPELREHLLGLFERFIQRDAVVEELTQLIDPRPTASLDLNLLREEFISAGFDPDTVPFEGIIPTLAASFYEAAAKTQELQGAIEIALLRRLVENSGAQLALSLRQTQAAECSAECLGDLTVLTEQLVKGQQQTNELLESAQRSASSGQPGTQFDTYQQLAAGLGRTGCYIDLSEIGSVVIVTAGAEIAPALDLSPLSAFLDELRRRILSPAELLSPAEIAAREQRYRDLITCLYCSLRLEGLSTSVRPINLPLDRVYVHLRAVAEVPEAADVFSPDERRMLRLIEEGGRAEEIREAGLRLDAVRRERWSTERLERFPIAEALRAPERRALVVLGDPGSGKTTLLHFLALIFARGPEEVQRQLAISGPESDRLPIFAPLAAYDEMLNEDSSLTILEFLGRYYDRRRAAPGLDPVFQQALDAGRALVLLDGLDEVVEEARRKYVSEQVDSFIRQAVSSGNRVLLTSRIYGYRAAPLSGGLPHVTVLDFRREEMEIFAHQWSRAMVAWDAGGQVTPQTELLAQEEERRLLEGIRSNPGVERLAVNPLLLTMLALLRRQVGALPQRRIELYDLYLRTLIQNWEENRTRGARLTTPKRTDNLEAEKVLIPLSLWLQQEKASGTATRDQLLARLLRTYLEQDAGLDPDAPDIPPPEWHKARRRAEMFLADMRQFSGLLVERGHNAYGFRHLTFQEYFAGRALARKEPGERWELIRPNLHSNRWREPILLAAARLGVLESRQDQATALVEQILGAGSDYEAILHRDLFLAADCATDDIGVDLRVLRRLVNDLRPLASSPVPTLAVRAVDLLTRLALLRSGEDARLPEAFTALVSVLESTDPYRLGPTLESLRRVWQGSTALRQSVIRFIVRRAERQPWVPPREIKQLTPFLIGSPELRAAFLAQLEHPERWVSASAIRWLASMVGHDGAVRTAILAKLEAPDEEVRAAAVAALAALVGQDLAVRGLVLGRLDDPSQSVCDQAADALTPLLGQDAEVRAAVLAKLAGSETAFGLPLIYGLGGVVEQYPEVRSALLAKLQNPSEVVRAAAIHALATLVGHDSEVRTEVVAKLDDPGRYVRIAVIRVLAALVDKDPAIASAICPFLSDRDWRIRETALNALADPARRQAISAELIAGALGNQRCLESAEARASAVGALARLVAQSAPVRSAVFAKLEDPDSVVRAAAIRALAKLVAQDAEARMVIIARLQDPDNNVRAAAVGALSGLVAQDTEARAAIFARLQDPEDDVRAAAVGALSGLVAQDTEARAAIIARLQDPEDDVRAAAIRALAELIAQDAEARAALLAELQDPSWNVRVAATGALAPLVTQHNEVRAAILARLQDPDNDVRAAAIHALARLLAQDAEARTLVYAKLEGPGDDVCAAISALGRLVTEDAHARAAVLAKLEDPNGLVRAAAIDALAGLIPQHVPLRRAVFAKLDDPDDSVRAAATAALDSLVAQDGDVQAAVFAKLQDRSWEVRSAAAHSIAPYLEQYPDSLSALMPLLSADDRAGGMRRQDKTARQALVQALGGLVSTNAELRNSLVQALCSEDWRLRQSAAEVFAAAEGIDLQGIAPFLLAATDEHRGLDSWRARIAAAEILINDRQFSADALETLLPALDYGTHLLAPVRIAGYVRRRAAVALGKLKAEFRSPALFSRLERLLQEDPDPGVLDAAFDALLSLAAAPEPA